MKYAGLGNHPDSDVALQSTKLNWEWWSHLPVIDAVPKAVQVACHHGDAQTNKPSFGDGMVAPLISPLHNADKASADLLIGQNYMTTFNFQKYFYRVPTQVLDLQILVKSYICFAICKALESLVNGVFL